MSENQLRNKQGLTESEFLAAYDPGIYEKPSVTVDMLVFWLPDTDKKNIASPGGNILKLLMIKRGDHPYMGQWALPGGFVNLDESLDEAAARELKEETGLENIPMEQLYTWGEVPRDPRARVIGVSYMGCVTGPAPDIRGNDDADAAAWFNVDYRIDQEDKTITEKGYILEQLYKLRLSNDADDLAAMIKVARVAEGQIGKVARKIVASPGVAFDHAKIISYAIENLQDKHMI